MEYKSTVREYLDGTKIQKFGHLCKDKDWEYHTETCKPKEEYEDLEFMEDLLLTKGEELQDLNKNLKSMKMTKNQSSLILRDNSKKHIMGLVSMGGTGYLSSIL